MAGHDGDPYEGVQIELVNPMTAGPVFPTLSYRAQLLRSGQTTAPFRHAASQLYFVLEGEGYTEVNGERDRKSVVEGKSVSVRVDLGGRRIMKKKKINSVS